MSDPIHDINDTSPTSLSHLIGQRSVIEQVKVALDAAQQDGRKFDHALCVGGPGLGKTQICQVIGQEMATDYLEFLGQSITSVADLNAVLLSATDRAIVTVDECHELPKSVQTALYLALDRKKVILQAGKTGGTPISIPIANFSLLLATTDEYQLLAPLRDRMRLILRFEFYTVEELRRFFGIVLDHWVGNATKPCCRGSPNGAVVSLATPFVLPRPLIGLRGRKGIPSSRKRIWIGPVCWRISTTSASAQPNRHTYASWQTETLGSM